jgi:hypothetical protein
MLRVRAVALGGLLIRQFLWARCHARFGDATMPQELAADYRERSGGCRQKAVESSDPKNKAYWLKFAEKWLQLAQNDDPKAAKSE